MTTTAVTRILVPVDFSPQSDRAVGYATTFGTRFGARVDLLHVVEDPFALGAWEGDTERPDRRALLEGLSVSARHRLDAMAGAFERLGVTAMVHVRPGRPAAAIHELAEECGTDLIVMGTHGRTGIAHLLMGSVAEQVVRSAPCPVLTVGKAKEAVEATLPLRAPVPAPAS
ncbi:MAG: universal stress protein [Vicinamibacterales bacterium]